jgi:nitrite reductase (NADH) small subunit
MGRLVKVGEVNELESGQGKLVQVDGQDIALFNVGGTHYAMGAGCPHEEGPLHEGEMDGETVICPWHGYDFDLRTGECSVDSELRVMTYAVKIHEDNLFIEVA